MRTLEEAIADYLGNLARWRTERRAGVEHWISGQHVAEAVESAPGVDEGVYVLAFASVSGHHINLVCAMRDGALWRALGADDAVILLQRSRAFGGRQTLSRTFTWTPAMLGALDAAHQAVQAA